MKIKVTNIEWDLNEGDAEAGYDLPTECEIEIESAKMIPHIDDLLTAKHGWCIRNLKYKVVG